MALTKDTALGYQEEDIHVSIKGVQTSYNDLMEALSTDTQTSFVDQMATEWACMDAQKFFIVFKQIQDQLITDTENIFKSVVEAMDGAGTRWAADTGSSYARIGFSSKMKKLNVDSVRENIDGIRGVDKTSANDTAKKLDTILEKVRTNLTKAKQAVNSCGFLGGAQASSLQQSLNTIGRNVEDAFTRGSEAAKKSIENTVVKYGDTAGAISEAFAGQEA